MGALALQVLCIRCKVSKHGGLLQVALGHCVSWARGRHATTGPFWDILLQTQP